MRYITVKNLSYQYDSEPVLEGITYHLDSGEFVTLTGENGAAKSTLIKATLGILKPKVGSVAFSKTNVAGKNYVWPICPSKLLVLMQVFLQQFMNLLNRVVIRAMAGFVV